MIGTTLSHFRIEAKAGAGGMGEVYRARDTRLDRTVAIKVLPAELAADPALRERLKREAVAISKLNHPHVCTLYDIGHEDGVDYLVLEYLEGATLADRLGSGALPLSEALKIAGQIADGLDAAHRLGIVHRDLKPGNVMLTASGAKLLDFGLAKEYGGAGPASSMIATQPVSSAGDSATAEGTILGTLLYMSPEQLHGEPADARSDLFSFGAMLYEMVTGVAPFQGKSQASVIASILEKQPAPVSERSAVAPKALERLIARCLEKDPESRYQNARDVMHELQWIAGGGAEEGATGPVVAPRRGLLMPVLATIVATVGVLGLLVWLLPGLGLRSPTTETVSAPQASVRAMIPLPPDHRIAGWASPTVAISDDGSTLAFVATGPGERNVLYVRPLAGAESIRVPDSDTAEGPVFSPDGQWVLFAVSVSGGARDVPPELRKYSLESGLTQTLCPVRDYFGADWREDGTIVWFDQIPKGLWRIGADGGDPENFLATGTRDGKEIPLVGGWPRFLPDGRRMVVSLVAGPNFQRGSVIDLETGQVTDLGVAATALWPLADGRLAWMDNKDALMVAPFDATLGKLGAAGRAVDRGISVGGGGCPVMAVAGNGTAVLTRGALLGTRESPRQLVRLERDGSVTSLPIDPGIYGAFALSPDGTRAVLATPKGLRIHHLDRGGGTDVPLGGLGVYPQWVTWSPDGAWISFSGSREDATSLNVFVVAADGTAEPRVLFKAESEAWCLDWDQADNSLLVADFAIGGTARVRALRVPLDGGEPEELGLEVYRSSVRLAPNGGLLACLQPQGESMSVIVRSYPQLGPSLVVAGGAYLAVRWSRDGQTLYALDQDGVDAFSIEREPQLKVAGQRREMSGIEDVAMRTAVPNGDGFYALQDVPGSGVVTQVEVVVNWVGGLP